MKRTECKLFKGQNYIIAVAKGRGREEEFSTRKTSEAFERAALRNGFKVCVLSVNNPEKLFTFQVEENRSFTDMDAVLGTLSGEFNICLTLGLDKSLAGEDFEYMKEPHAALAKEQMLYSYPR